MLREKQKENMKRVFALSLVAVLLLSVALPATSIAKERAHIDKTIINHGEWKTPVTEGDLFNSGIISADAYYGTGNYAPGGSAWFTNDDGKYTVTYNSEIQFNWDESIISRDRIATHASGYEWDEPIFFISLVKANTGYTQSSEKDVSNFAVSTAWIGETPDNLDLSSLFSENDFNNSDFVYLYQSYDLSYDPYEDYANRRCLYTYYVIEKDNYNVSFKDTGIYEDQIIAGSEGTMYRLYNPNSGEHFYTASLGEAQFLYDEGWKYEHFAWTGPTTSNAPVYRLYNPNNGDHHYTISANERDMLALAGWNDEGIAWYSDENNTTPLYRLYNPNCEGAGSHHYTLNETERDSLIAAGWIDEGIGWYGL